MLITLDWFKKSLKIGINILKGHDSSKLFNVQLPKVEFDQIFEGDTNKIKIKTCE
jgi:hypothetical protein